MTPATYWYDPEWRALLLAVVAEPEDEVRWMRCADWLSERGELAAERWERGQVDTVWRGTSAEWYQSIPAQPCVWCVKEGQDPACVICRQDGERVYPCKELAWALPLREVVFVDEQCRGERILLYKSATPLLNRSELAIYFARTDERNSF